MKKRTYTTPPCGVKLRLDVGSGAFSLIGDWGFPEARTPKHMSLNSLASTKNLLALSAFFLARAQERLLQDDD